MNLTKSDCVEMACDIASALTEVYNDENGDLSAFLYENVVYCEEIHGGQFVWVYAYFRTQGPLCWLDTERNRVVCCWHGEIAAQVVDKDIAEYAAEFFTYDDE